MIGIIKRIYFGEVQIFVASMLLYEVLDYSDRTVIIPVLISESGLLEIFPRSDYRKIRCKITSARMQCDSVQ